MAIVQHDVALALALATGSAAVLGARLPRRALERRLLHVNLFFALLLATLPWAMADGGARFWNPLTWSREGLRMAVRMTVRGNAIVLWVTALMASLSPFRIGRALAGLGLPDRLAHLVSLLVRQLDLLHEESLRMRRALRARAFEPRSDLHTLRTQGYLVGGVIVRALDRADRVLGAMKCRGYDGRFSGLLEPPWSRRDRLFVASTLLATVLLAAWDRLS